MPLDRRVVVEAALEYLTAASLSRAANNATNSAKTTLRRHIRKFMDDNGYKEYRLGIDDVELYLDVSTSEKVDPKAVIDMFMNGEITKDQFAEIIDVRKEDAKRILGGDVVDINTVSVRGKEIDVRTAKAEVAYAQPTDIKPVTVPVKQTSSPAKKRKINIQPKVSLLPTRQLKPLRRVAIR